MGLAPQQVRQPTARGQCQVDLASRILWWRILFTFSRCSLRAHPTLLYVMSVSLDTFVWTRTCKTRGP